jgi:hypothetical protein
MPKASRKKMCLRDAIKDTGQTLRSFALLNGFKVSTTYAAASGLIDGPKARTVRRQLEKEVACV